MIMSKLSVVIVDAPGMHQVLKLFLILTAFRQDSRFHHPLCLYQCTRRFGSNSQLVGWGLRVRRGWRQCPHPHAVSLASNEFLRHLS